MDTISRQEHVTQPGIPPLAHTDKELMRIRMKLTPGQRLQAMLDARMVLIGFRRARLRRQYPDLSERDLNLKLLEEIDRAKKLADRPHPIPGYPT